MTVFIGIAPRYLQISPDISRYLQIWSRMLGDSFEEREAAAEALERDISKAQDGYPDIPGIHGYPSIIQVIGSFE